MFTFENVFDNRIEFQLECKKKDACDEEYEMLMSANDKESFMQVIYDNYMWINKKIEDFIPKFDDAFSFSEGLARVKLNDKWGFIYKSGTIVIEPKFDNVSSFNEGIACIKLNDKWGYIDTTGNYLVEPKFDNVSSFNEGFARVELNGLWSRIDTKGNFTETKDL